MNMLERVVPDEIRGVGEFHSRVHPGSEAELDRLHQSSGVQAPWMPGEDEGDEKEELRPSIDAVRLFLHSLVQAGPRIRRILFARTINLEWMFIGAALLGGASSAGVQAEFDKAMEDFPALKRAFKEPIGAASDAEEWAAFNDTRMLLHTLAKMGERRREIVFERLLGKEWSEIGRDTLKRKSPQAAQNEFRKTLEEFPALRQAFQKRQPSTQEETT